MHRTPRIRVIDIAAHRNGICGAPFHVILFEEPTATEERLGVPVSTKVAVVFDAAHHCAVLDVDKLTQFDVAFGSNSWRGDRYEPTLHTHIANFEKGNL
jgi:hypothetical protein